MKHAFRLSALALGAALAFLTCPAGAQDTNAPAPVTAVVAGNTATNPVPRDPKWVERLEGFVKIAQAGGVDLLFLGDSITDFWRNRGSNVWNKYYGARHAANFGISGDRTEHVLWRIDQGELDGIKPRVVVLMIGTNNIGDSAENIIKADTKIVAEIHEKLPDTRLLLLGIFPRGADPKNAGIAAIRGKIATINQALAKLDDNAKTRYLDIGGKFLDADGALPKDIMPDALHPNVKGYQIWADAMQPLLDELLK